MSRYIDADALIKQLKSSSAYNDYEWSMYADGFIEDIENAPTIEPKRGEWEVTDEDSWTNGTHALICSECGGGYHLNFERVIGDWSFCPNCGADMRKESE